MLTRYTSSWIQEVASGKQWYIAWLYYILTDINECLVNNGGCDPDAQCIKTPGCLICVCDYGYSGSVLECYVK